MPDITFIFPVLISFLSKIVAINSIFPFIRIILFIVYLSAVICTSHFIYRAVWGLISMMKLNWVSIVTSWRAATFRRRCGLLVRKTSAYIKRRRRIVFGWFERKIIFIKGGSPFYSSGIARYSRNAICSRKILSAITKTSFSNG